MILATVYWPKGNENSEVVEYDDITAHSYHAMCRRLVAAGYEDQPITFHRDGKAVYTIKSIFQGAKFSVEETSKGILPPRLVKYKPINIRYTG